MYKRQDEQLASRIQTPFPALSSAERFHFETYGYVILEQVFSEADVAEMKAAVLDTFDRFQHAEAAGVEDPSLMGANTHHFEPGVMRRLNGMGFSHERFIDFNTHPYIVGMCEEVCGSAVRLNETTAIANTKSNEQQMAFGWHRGADVQVSCHTKNNLFHCNFVKTLVNLTDFGPDSGGTVCLPGTHKLDIPQQDLRAFANEHAHLAHQFIAPKGSVFLFAESLIHATGHNRSDEERVLFISSFCNRMLPNWDRYIGRDPLHEEAYLAQFPDHLRLHFRGYADWTRGQRYRQDLLQAPQICDHALGSWRDRPAEAFRPWSIEVDAR